jgi:hypothetical protein
MVANIQQLIDLRGAGRHLQTAQEAGIRSLTDSEIRAVLRELHARGAVKIRAADLTSLPCVDFRKLFVALHDKRRNLSPGPVSLAELAEALEAEGADISLERLGR